jgi:RHS repeat-associated protein
MPTSITKNGAGYLRYVYDGNNQRVKKVGPSTTVRYYGDAYEERINAGGTVGVIHLYTGTQRVVSVRSDGNEQYYHGDHIGSASVVTDGTGGIREKIEYFPFGSYRERSDYGSTFPDVNYTFTGQEDDDEVGLYNYKARLYDPVLGRFISADSVVPDWTDLQSLNRYSYCLNNPVKYVDPTGHAYGLSGSDGGEGEGETTGEGAGTSPVTVGIEAMGAPLTFSDVEAYDMPSNDVPDSDGEGNGNPPTQLAQNRDLSSPQRTLEQELQGVKEYAKQKGKEIAKEEGKEGLKEAAKEFVSEALHKLGLIGKLLGFAWDFGSHPEGGKVCDTHDGNGNPTPWAECQHMGDWGRNYGQPWGNPGYYGR